METKTPLFYTCPECGLPRTADKNKFGNPYSCQDCGNTEEPVAHYEKVIVQEDIFIKARNLVVDLIQEESGCRFTDIEYLNGYYLLDFEVSVVLRFKVKDIPNYLFGLWFIFNEETNEINIDFFGEHEWKIDKFKPTATGISSRNKYSESISLTKFLSIAEDRRMMRNLAWHPIYYATDKLTHLKSDWLGVTYGTYRGFTETCGPALWILRDYYDHYTMGLRDFFIDLRSEFQLKILEFRIKYFYKKHGVILTIDRREKGCYPGIECRIGIPSQSLDIKDKRVTGVVDDYVYDLWDRCKPLRNIEDHNIMGGRGLCVNFIPIDEEGNLCGYIFNFGDDNDEV